MPIGYSYTKNIGIKSATMLNNVQNSLDISTESQANIIITSIQRVCVCGAYVKVQRTGIKRSKIDFERRRTGTVYIRLLAAKTSKSRDEEQLSHGAASKPFNDVFSFMLEHQSNYVTLGRSVEQSSVKY